MIDGSRIRIKKYYYFFIFEITRILQHQYKAGQYLRREDMVQLHSGLIKRHQNNTDLICKTISHEFLHMILYHIEGNEACTGLDRFLAKRKRYAAELIGNGGI